MPQHDYGNPTSPFTGTQLNNRLRDWRDALHSLHRGTSRPTYAVAGMLWLLEISLTEWRLQLYDGDTDILLGTINPTANTFTPAGVTGFAPLTGATFTGPVVVPNATADGHALNRVTADARYAQLTGAAFSGSVVVPNATADGHALNRITGDGRYARLTGAVTLEAPLTLPASNPTDANHATRKGYVDQLVAQASIWEKIADATVSNSTIIDITGFSLQNYRMVRVMLLGVRLSSAASSPAVTTMRVYRGGTLISTGYNTHSIYGIGTDLAGSTAGSNVADIALTSQGLSADPLFIPIDITQPANNISAVLYTQIFYMSQTASCFTIIASRVTSGSAWVDGIRITFPNALQANVGRIVVLGLKP
jgi:hypothetical protein